MKCELIIDSSLLTENDMVLLNEGGEEIQFCKTDTNHFLPPEVILILIDLSQNMAYSAAYDTVKYALGKLVSMFTERGGKRKHKQKWRLPAGIKGILYRLILNLQRNKRTSWWMPPQRNCWKKTNQEM